MDHMFETQNLEAGDVARSSADAVNISRLRSALDICVEELPPLLELGQIPEFVQAEYDFPYHRPSVLSMATESSTMMPETIGYVLLQVNEQYTEKKMNKKTNKKKCRKQLFDYVKM